MRAKQWQLDYGDRATASKLWIQQGFKDTLPPLELDQMPTHFLTDKLRKDIALQGLPMRCRQFGPPWHSNLLQLLLIQCMEASKLDANKITLRDGSVLKWPQANYTPPPCDTDKYDTWWLRFGVVRWIHCHADCEKSDELLVKELPGMMRALLKHIGLVRKSVDYIMWVTPEEGRQKIQMLDSEEFEQGAQFLMYIKAAKAEEGLPLKL